MKALRLLLCNGLLYTVETMTKKKKSTSPKIKSGKKKTFVLQAMLLSALRRAFRKYPPYQEVLKNAKKEYYIPSKKGDKKLRRVHFKCAICGNYFSSKQVAVDHIESVIDSGGFVDYNTYIERLYCTIDKLRVLCHNCHTSVTNAFNKLRRQKKIAKLNKDKVVKKKREKK